MQHETWIELRVRPRCPEGRSPSVTDFAAEDETAVESGEAIEDIAELGLYLVYRRADGGVTERRVTCRRLEQHGERLYLQAYCHEARAPRSFRLDRICEVVDLSTGEVLADERAIRSFFGEYAVHRRTEPGLNASLTVLTFLAACDDEVDLAELEVIHDFIDRYTAAFGGEEKANRKAHRVAEWLAPEYSDLRRALRWFQRDPDAPEVARFLIPWIDRVVAADGRVDEREVDALIELMEPIERSAARASS